MARRISEEEREQFTNYLKKLLDMKDGLPMFAEDFMKHRMPIEMPKFHKQIYYILSTCNRAAIAAPRSFAKTTVTDVIYVSYLALFNLPMRNNICIFSNTQSLAIDQLKKIKYEYDNNKSLIDCYIKIYGKLPHTDKETWRDDEIHFSNGVIIQARGAGMQTRGKRPNVVICDDLETTDGVRSADQRKNLDEWFRKDIIGLLEPNGQLIIIGTILHYASLLKTLIDEMKQYGWITKIYKAYWDGVQEVEHELWKNKWSHEALQQRKNEQGSAYFSAEYMNEPVDDSVAPIKREHIRYWESLPDKYSVVISVDPAYSEDEKADYKIASLVAIDDKNNRYLIKYLRTHQPQSEFFNGILNMWSLHKHCCQAIGIPNQGVEKSFYQSFLKFCEERAVFPPVRELHNRGAGNASSIRNKKDRIVATLQPIFEQGKYYIHKSHKEAEEELLGIGSTRNDDLVDSMAYAEQILQPSYNGIVYTNSEDSNNITFPKAENYGME